MDTEDSSIPCIAITAGEPAGIGPDLCVLMANQAFNANIVVIGDVEMLKARAAALKLNVNFQTHNSADAAKHLNQHLGDGTLCVLQQPTQQTVIAGQLNAHNSAYVLNILHTAALGTLPNNHPAKAQSPHLFDAMVTAPVHKGIINDAGIAFSGHTEYLAELTHTPQVVMMLVGGNMRVALATTHLALKDIPAAITQPSLETTIRILHHDLMQKFGLPNPRILVAGLNPHAGENGYLGMEEITVINPVLEKLRLEGMQLIGALPADTLFAKHHLSSADAVLAMYHDQGLPVLKHASFGEGVNVTLGLPIIRTSVDHGTALDLAGTGKIDFGSMLAAIELAIALATSKKTKKIN